jgi:glycosyltransferase involved in cell wall biosynthesis
MRVLYAAIDQTVPGTKGGSVHVRAVAEGLAALGHDVHVLASPGERPFPEGRVMWTAMRPPFAVNQLRWVRAKAIRRIAERLRPDVVIERYYNFAGEGILAGSAVGAVTVLEVNAPVIDYRGSSKALLDRAFIVEPMRRWREHLCRRSDLIVTPSAAILPNGTPGSKVLELEWGADIERFHQNAGGPLPFKRPPGVVAVFAGAFRRWHGAIHLVRALKLLRAEHQQSISAVFIGDGPELPNVRAEAEGLDDVVFAGAVEHERMPACLSAADIGVAPFDLDAHPSLTLGFYWSPLKIFEYMATGLPVVAPRVGRIPALVGHEREGILYNPPSPVALAEALIRFADPQLRQQLGRAARERAVREYSWKSHCEALERAIVGRVKHGRARAL